jgi:predicted ATP-grasp superfamily ATP-dependent carboligase
MSTIWAIGASVRALAQSLTRAGHRVIAADLFDDLDLQQAAVRTQRIVDYPCDLLHLVDDVVADAFIYTGGLENEPDLIDQLAERLPLMGNPGRVLRRVRDAFLLHDTLVRGGFAMPLMTKQMPVLSPHRWLQKSASSSGGLRVGWASSLPDDLSKNDYFQQFIDGAVYGASFHAADGSVRLLGVARQLTDCAWTNAPRFHYAGSVGPVTLPAGLQDEVERLGPFLACEFNLRGWFGVDFVVDAHGQLFVLEANPRYTASMELLEQGTSSLAAKAILYADRAVSVTSEFSQRLMQRGDVADIPTSDTTLCAGSPVCSIFARGASEQLILAELREKVLSLSVEVAKPR